MEAAKDAGQRSKALNAVASVLASRSAAYLAAMTAASAAPSALEAVAVELEDASFAAVRGQGELHVLRTRLHAASAAVTASFTRPRHGSAAFDATSS